MMIRDPLNRSRWVRVNDEYDQSDVIIENELSQKKEFKDVEKVNQLTQNGYNLSPYTRTDAYRDVTIERPKAIGRIERYKSPYTKSRYHDN